MSLLAPPVKALSDQGTLLCHSQRRPSRHYLARAHYCALRGGHWQGTISSTLLGHINCALHMCLEIWHIRGTLMCLTSVDDFSALECAQIFESVDWYIKILEALNITQSRPNLNTQLANNGSSFMLSIF